MAESSLIYIGDMASPAFSFGSDEITQISIDNSVDLVGSDLNTDVMDVDVLCDDTDETLRSLPWATPIRYYRGGELVGKYYITTVIRTGSKAYRIRSTSAAGILEHETFYGGIYTGHSFQTVAEQIIGTNGLQPYKGIYKKATFKHDLVSPYNDHRGYFLGKYFNMSETSTVPPPSYVYGNSFWKATMSSKLHANLRIIGSQVNGFSSTATKRICYLVGCACDPSATSTLLNARYGLYMVYTRTSSSVPWADYGTLYFAYEGTVINLGVPSEGATFEIDVDPVAGEATINETTYSISYNASLANNYAALHIYGQGVRVYETGGSVASNAETNVLVIEYGDYKVTSQSNDVQCDVVTIKDEYTNELRFVDLSNWLFSTDKVSGYGDISVSLQDIVPYEGEYGESPLFDSITDVQKEILSDINYSSGVESLLVYGWLPICSKREALHQLLFSQGVILIKDDDGGLLFTAPKDMPVGQVTQDEIYNAGYSEQIERTNSVSLTEHSFTQEQGAEAVVCADNPDGPISGTYIVTHTNAPIVSTTIVPTGFNLIYSNCNASIVSGSGTLSGVPYKHGEAVLKRDIAEYPNGRAITASGSTLVTVQNSAYVLDRLEAYYGHATKVKIDIIESTERCGLFYDAFNAFGEAISGFLSRASKTVSSIIRSACEFIVGYDPPAIGEGYSNYAILTGSGTWDVPASVFEKDTPRIRVVVIGGGQGGASGYAGADGQITPKSGSSTPASGGNVGNPGSPGRVLDVTIENPAASYTFDCGVGGEGGAISTSTNANNLGSDGTHTTFSGGGDTYDSATGSLLNEGYVNFFTGDIYASQFLTPSFSTFSHGGNGGYFQYTGQTVMNWASKGCNMFMGVVDSWPGGAQGTSYIVDGVTWAFGGGGGGAGFGSAGSAGTAASKSGSTYKAGNGGNGGNATYVPPKATVYNSKYFGYGGHPGGGGGGGGASGWVGNYYTSATGTAGQGGHGGRGGDGGDGCVLIYY